MRLPVDLVPYSARLKVHTIRSSLVFLLRIELPARTAVYSVASAVNLEVGGSRNQRFDRRGSSNSRVVRDPKGAEY